MQPPAPPPTLYAPVLNQQRVILQAQIRQFEQSMENPLLTPLQREQTKALLANAQAMLRTTLAYLGEPVAAPPNPAAAVPRAPSSGPLVTPQKTPAREPTILSPQDLQTPPLFQGMPGRTLAAGYEQSPCQERENAGRKPQHHLAQYHGAADSLVLTSSVPDEPLLASQGQETPGRVGPLNASTPGANEAKEAARANLGSQGSRESHQERDSQQLIQPPLQSFQQPPPNPFPPAASSLPPSATRAEAIARMNSQSSREALSNLAMAELSRFPRIQAFRPAEITLPPRIQKYYGKSISKGISHATPKWKYCRRLCGKVNMFNDHMPYILNALTSSAIDEAKKPLSPGGDGLAVVRRYNVLAIMLRFMELIPSATPRANGQIAKLTPDIHMANLMLIIKAANGCSKTCGCNLVKLASQIGEDIIATVNLVVAHILVIQTLFVDSSLQLAIDIDSSFSNEAIGPSGAQIVHGPTAMRPREFSRFMTLWSVLGECLYVILSLFTSSNPCFANCLCVPVFREAQQYLLTSKKLHDLISDPANRLDLSALPQIEEIYNRFFNHWERAMGSITLLDERSLLGDVPATLPPTLDGLDSWATAATGLFLPAAVDVDSSDEDF